MIFSMKNQIIILIVNHTSNLNYLTNNGQWSAKGAPSFNRLRRKHFENKEANKEMDFPVFLIILFLTSLDMCSMVMKKE